MAGKNSIKFVVDENIAAVLDDFYKWAKVGFFIFDNFCYFDLKILMKLLRSMLVKQRPKNW